VSAGILLFFAFVLGSFQYASEGLPLKPVVGPAQFPQETDVYDRQGQLIFRRWSEEKRRYVKLQDISKWASLAFVAAEDKRFFHHKGVDLVAVVRALVYDFSPSSPLIQGGSTITQQLARLSFLSPEKTLTRKLKEILLSLRLERRYSKSQILEFYLNKIPFGGRIYGIEQASEEFFGKEASKLDIAQAAFLASLPQAPSFFSPYGKHFAQLLKRQKDILKKMYLLGFINKKQLKEALLEKISLKNPKVQPKNAPHFIDFVAAKIRKIYPAQLSSRGLNIFTTLDLKLQKKAQGLVKEARDKLKRKYGIDNLALVLLDSRTGGILAMAGSYDYRDKSYGQFNAAVASRQPGSTLKPFIYAHAFDELGIRENSLLPDRPLSFGGYRPHNYGSFYFGRVKPRFALLQSLNIPAVWLLDRIGLEKEVEKLNKCGLELSPDAGLSLALGGSATSLLHLTSAYTAFANRGICLKTKSFVKITDKKGRLLRIPSEPGQKIFSEQAAAFVNDILKDTKKHFSVFRRVAQNPVFESVAIKTGTSDGPKDVWIIGWSPKVVLGIWAGRHDDRTLKPNTLALYALSPLFEDYMKFALDYLKD